MRSYRVGRKPCTCGGSIQGCGWCNGSGTVEYVMDDRYHLSVPKYPRFWRWLLRWLQRKCKHYNLKADILEGDCKTFGVRWCETCGAHCITIDGTPTSMRECEPRHED